jgi:Co/Zn/Cd efflux system component
MYSEYVKRKYGRLDDTTRFVLEVGIPSFSVLALLGVTAWITYDAILVIRNPEDGSVNVLFLFGFASANALVDIICSLLFFLRRKDVLLNVSTGVPGSVPSVSKFPSDVDPVQSVNLNMASALTHVCGDTLRTTALFLAALIATVTDISGAVCDAWAAVVVTVTILFIVIPLSSEIYRHAKNHPFFTSSSPYVSPHLATPCNLAEV